MLLATVLLSLVPQAADEPPPRRTVQVPPGWALLGPTDVRAVVDGPNGLRRILIGWSASILIDVPSGDVVSALVVDWLAGAGFEFDETGRVIVRRQPVLRVFDARTGEELTVKGDKSVEIRRARSVVWSQDEPAPEPGGRTRRYRASLSASGLDLGWVAFDVEPEDLAGPRRASLPALDVTPELERAAPVRDVRSVKAVAGGLVVALDGGPLVSFRMGADGPELGARADFALEPRILGATSDGLAVVFPGSVLLRLDPTTFEERGRVDLGRAEGVLAFSDSGAAVLLASRAEPPRVAFLDGRAPVVLETDAGAPSAAAFDGAGSKVALLQGQRVMLFDVASGARTATLDVPEDLAARALALAVDGQVVVSGRATGARPGGRIDVLDPKGGAPESWLPDGLEWPSTEVERLEVDRATGRVFGVARRDAAVSFVPGSADGRWVLPLARVGGQWLSIALPDDPELLLVTAGERTLVLERGTGVVLDVAEDPWTGFVDGTPFGIRAQQLVLGRGDDRIACAFLGEGLAIDQGGAITVVGGEDPFVVSRDTARRLSCFEAWRPPHGPVASLPTIIDGPPRIVRAEGERVPVRVVVSGVRESAVLEVMAPGREPVRYQPVGVGPNGVVAIEVDLGLEPDEGASTDRQLRVIDGRGLASPRWRLGIVRD